MGAPNYITDDKGNIVYPRTLAKCVKKGGTTLDDYLDKLEDNLLIKPTAQGTDIQLQDSSDMNIQELHIYGRTEQASTTGANLFDVNDRLSFNSIFKVDEEGYITATIPANNTEGNQYYDFFTKKSDLLKIDTEYLIATEILEIPTEKCQLNVISLEQISKGQFANAVAKTIKGIKFDKAKTRNDMSGCVAMMRGFMFTQPGFTGGKIKFRVSVLEDTTITADTFKYEPYTGGMSSPNPDYPQAIVSVENPKLNISGKNILKQSVPTVSFDKNTKVTKLEESENKIKIKINEVGEYIYISIPLKNIIKEIKANKAYTIVFNNATQISNCFFGSGNATIKLTNYAYCKENKVVLKTLSELPNNPKQYYIYIGIYNKKGNIAGFDDIAVFEGDYSNVNINSIEPYKPLQTATLNYELNGIDDVRDELIVRTDGTGQLIQRISEEKFKFKGFSESADCPGRYVKINCLKNNYKKSVKGFCNIASYSDWGIPKDNSWIFGITQRNMYLAPPKNENYTLNELNEYLADIEIAIIAQLEEPIVTDLTVEEVQKLLALHTNKPNTTIWNDQNAEMQITYVADTKKYIDDKFEELSEAITTSTTINSLDTSN